MLLATDAGAGHIPTCQGAWLYSATSFSQILPIHWFVSMMASVAAALISPREGVSLAVDCSPPDVYHSRQVRRVSLEQGQTAGLPT
jgi:hypothetical protein